MNAIITIDDLTLHGTEPCIQDLRMAEALGFEQVHEIRRLIKRNLQELRIHGEVLGTVTETPSKGGRPGTEYLLNQAQALLICMFSRTDRAAEVRKLLIEVFLQWYRGDFNENPLAANSIFAPNDLQVMWEKTRMVRECRLLHGKPRARRLWATLGLPDVSQPEYQETEDMECLNVILGHLTENGTIRELARQALETSPQAENTLARYGIKVTHHDAGIIISNRDPNLRRIFEDTRWYMFVWSYALRTLPGSYADKRCRFNGEQHRCTFIPARYLV